MFMRMITHARVCITRVHAIILHMSAYLSVYRALTQDRMNFSRFRRLVSRSASNDSVPRYCYTLPLWYRHRGCLVFHSGMRVTDLPPIQMSIQPEKIEKWTSEFNYHEESTQEDEFVAIT